MAFSIFVIAPVESVESQGSPKLLYFCPIPVFNTLMGHILNIKIPQQKVFFDIVVGLGFVENLFLVILLTFISSYCCTELKVRYTKEKKSNLILLRVLFRNSRVIQQ